MHVRAICNNRGFESLRGTWQELLEQSQPNHVFMTWEWLYTWWNFLGHGLQLSILVAEEKGKVVGIVPLALSVKRFSYGGKIRTLQFLGRTADQSWCDWMDVIAVRKQEVLSAALSYLQERQHLWDFLDLWDLSAESETVSVLSETVRQFGFSLEMKPLQTCPYLPVSSDWEGYYNTIPPKKVRLDLDRQTRRLLAQGDMTVHRKTGQDLDANLDVLFDLKGRRQETLQQTPLFSESVRRFYRGLVRALPQQWLDCSVMTVGKTVFAAHFGFRYNSKFYYYTPTFDPRFSRFAPGKLLLKFIIENCFADKTIQEFDFLRGKEPYKYQWATAERTGCALLIPNAYTAGWIGSIFRRSPLPIRSLLTKVSSASIRSALRGLTEEHLGGG